MFSPSANTSFSANKGFNPFDFSSSLGANAFCSFISFFVLGAARGSGYVNRVLVPMSDVM